MGHLNDLAMDIHRGNVSRGFYEKPCEKGTLLMLVTSELAEALEADRKGMYADAKTYIRASDGVMDEKGKIAFEAYIKDTFEDEIADAMIRLFDLAGHLGIDLDFHVMEKLKYNATRGYKHGKRY